MFSFSPILLRIFAVVIVAVSVFNTESFAKFKGWLELPQSAHDLKEPKIDSEANLEFLYRKVLVNDRDFGSARRTEYYNRLKVFNEEGVKDLDVIDLLYAKGWTKVIDFAARVINPDGTVLELDKGDLYDRVLYADNDFEANVKSFSFPKLQVGSIVEYTWTDEDSSNILWGVDLALKANWPTQELYFEFVPTQFVASAFRSFNHRVSFQQTEDNRYIVKARGIEARLDEPFSPPFRDFEPWLFMRYLGDNDLLEEDEYWNERAKDLFDRTKYYVKPKQKAVRKLAQEMFKGMNDPEEKLRKAYEFCSTEIVNIHSARAGFTDEEIEALKDVDSPEETIKRGYGSGRDINRLFASLAGAAGFEVCLASCADQTVMSFKKSVLSRLNLREEIVALRVKGEFVWRYYDLGYEYLPMGYLDAKNVNSVVLLGNQKTAAFSNTPKMEPGFSSVHRKANLALSNTGALSGSVSLTYTGYSGVSRKRTLDSLSDSEREEVFFEEIRKLFPRCELSEFKVENLFERDLDLVVSYRVEVENYADQLGKRLFFQPNYFKYGSEPVFTRGRRASPVCFMYPWDESDEIKISLPEGFKLEEAASPGGSLKFDEISCKSVYSVNADETVLTCKRSYQNNARIIDANFYQSLKRMHSVVNEYDTHVVGIVAAE